MDLQRLVQYILLILLVVGILHPGHPVGAAFAPLL
jgi:hypothetical protein